MTDTATPTKTIMRDLLARWAELELERCKRIKTGLVANGIEWEEFYISDGDKELLTHSDAHDIDCSSNGALMWIQWAVQQAIVARGWAFELSYYSILGSYDVEIDIDSHRSAVREGNNPAEALLAAYLQALEYKPLDTK